MNFCNIYLTDTRSSVVRNGGLLLERYQTEMASRSAGYEYCPRAEPIEGVEYPLTVQYCGGLSNFRLMKDLFY